MLGERRTLCLPGMNRQRMKGSFPQRHPPIVDTAAQVFASPRARMQLDLRQVEKEPKRSACRQFLAQ